MLKLLKTALRHRHATVAYPARPLDVDPNFRGKPQYDARQCIACGACTAACPANALTMENDVANGLRRWSLNLGRCIFCARCEEVCPTAAIVLSPEFELAVWRKEDLQQRADFAICHCVECGAPTPPRRRSTTPWPCWCKRVNSAPNRPRRAALSSKPVRPVSRNTTPFRRHALP